MRLYLIRHGESVTNLSKIWTGWRDAKLTDKGREDARRVRDVISGISFDKVFSSDLSRAADTADIALPGCVSEKLSLIREINVGSLAGTSISLVTDEQWSRIREVGYSDFGGESNDELKARVSEFFGRVQALGAENVAAFSHGGFLQSSLDYIFGFRIPRGNILCRNCTVAVFEYTNDKWYLHSWINVK